MSAPPARSTTRSRASARRRARVLSAALVALIGGAQAPAFATDYERIEGSGSTWSQVIVDQWIADVNANGMQVTYNGGGSSVGRKNFAAEVTDFGISEIPYQGKDEAGGDDSAPKRDYAYVPIVAGGTAFTYHLEAGGELVRDIRLSGETIAKIFTNAITSWDDPAIAADNNGRVFPAQPIIPVVRSDGSGTTAQFTTWLDNQFSSIWRPYFEKAGLTSYYPIKSGSKMIGAAGSDQVMNTIAAASGNGTIGYVEYSFPLNKQYPVVKMLNAAGFFVEPTQYAVAVGLTRAKIDQDAASQRYLTQILDDVYVHTDPRAYPLSSYSYLLLPTGPSDQRMNTRKRQTLVDFMFYSLCEGQGKAGPFGYSPLPLNLVQAGFEQLGKLKTADPAVEFANRDATACNNPTFVAGDLSRNRLAEIAPPPPECDRAGAGPCLGAGQALGAAAGAPGASGAPGDAAAGGAAGTGGGGAAAGAGGAVGADGLPIAGSAIDPETGLPVGGGASGVGGALAAGAVASQISLRPAGGATAFGALAAAELLAIILIPGLLAARARRRALAA